MAPRDQDEDTAGEKKMKGLRTQKSQKKKASKEKLQPEIIDGAEELTKEKTSKKKKSRQEICGGAGELTKKKDSKKKKSQQDIINGGKKDQEGFKEKEKEICGGAGELTKKKGSKKEKLLPEIVDGAGEPSRKTKAKLLTEIVDSASEKINKKKAPKEVKSQEVQLQTVRNGIPDEGPQKKGGGRLRNPDSCAMHQKGHGKCLPNCRFRSFLRAANPANIEAVEDLTYLFEKGRAKELIRAVAKQDREKLFWNLVRAARDFKKNPLTGPSSYL